MAVEWIEGAPFSIVVTDADGTVVSMNRRACETFAGEGGGALVGHDIRRCHGERSRKIVESLFEAPRLNAYTIEKEGARKLIYQCPWFADGVFAGFVELSLPIPAELPHHVRGGSG